MRKKGNVIRPKSQSLWVYVPVRAEFSIEHERAGDEEEIEFQIKWSANK